MSSELYFTFKFYFFKVNISVYKLEIVVSVGVYLPPHSPNIKLTKQLFCTILLFEFVF